jgi:hypothetical protein
VKPETGETLLNAETAMARRIRFLDDWLDAFDYEFEKRIGVGIVSLKCILAYQRPLSFKEGPSEQAKVDIARSLHDWETGGRRGDAPLVFSKSLEDFLMRRILGAAERKGIPIQFHTGLLANPTGTLGGTDPLLLEDLFLAFPSVKFDLFHIGYPFYEHAAALAKTYANVFVDMCWAHIISPWASRQALHGFLDAVPYNKICAFGGDYGFVDGVFGHLCVARENVSRVLWEKVQEGTFSAQKALDIAQALFHDNPGAIFNLPATH